MEVLAILFWLVVLGADVAFIAHIQRVCLDFENWLDTKSAQRRRAGQAKGGHKMTDIVYHMTEEDAR